MKEAHNIKKTNNKKKRNRNKWKKNKRIKKSIINEKCLGMAMHMNILNSNTNDRMHDEQMSLSKALRVFESIRVAQFFLSVNFFKYHI